MKLKVHAKALSQCRTVSHSINSHHTSARDIFLPDRGVLKITEDEFSGPPMNVVLELIAGLTLCMWAALTFPMKFLSIHPGSNENRAVSKMITWVSRHFSFEPSLDVLVKG